MCPNFANFDSLFYIATLNVNYFFSFFWKFIADSSEKIRKSANIIDVMNTACCMTQVQTGHTPLHDILNHACMDWMRVAYIRRTSDLVSDASSVDPTDPVVVVVESAAISAWCVLGLCEELGRRRGALLLTCGDVKPLYTAARLRVNCTTTCCCCCSLSW